MQDQEGWKNTRAEEEQITAARTKQEDEEEDTGMTFTPEYLPGIMP